MRSYWACVAFGLPPWDFTFGKAHKGVYVRPEERPYGKSCRSLAVLLHALFAL